VPPFRWVGVGWALPTLPIRYPFVGWAMPTLLGEEVFELGFAVGGHFAAF
jgi:hypothetical protein